MITEERESTTEMRIQEILIEVLGLDEGSEEITANSDLVDELGAESIDFIDICFRLEKDFNLGKLVSSDIFPTVFDGQADFIESEFRKEMVNYPHITDDFLNEIIKEKSYKPLLKVKTLMQFVDWKLNSEQ